MTDLDSAAAYDFALPDERIATHPAATRSEARMLVMGGGRIDDRVVAELPGLLRAGDLLVVNDARVSPVRLSARRASGGAVEVFVLGMGAEGSWADPEAPLVALTRSNRRLQPGEVLSLVGGASLELLERADDGTARFAPPEGDIWATLDASGQMPLPPYITRRREQVGDAPSADEDRQRYQTVYARCPGAVAAPTAGLHFDEALLARLDELGVARAAVTLWVGVGTFAPVRGESMAEHELHAEHYSIPPEAAAAIEQARARGGRVVAVGTTVVRTLESAWDGVSLRTGPGSTRLFIRPGYEFGVVDALLTNFHLPRSSLLALVCAFGSHGRVMAAYRHAVETGYRFYSYGDAMFLPSRAASPGGEP